MAALRFIYEADIRQGGETRLLEPYDEAGWKDCELSRCWHMVHARTYIPVSSIIDQNMPIDLCFPIFGTCERLSGVVVLGKDDILDRFPLFGRSKLSIGQTINSYFHLPNY